MKKFVIYDLDNIRRSGIPCPNYPGQFMNCWTQEKADLYYALDAVFRDPITARRDENGHIFVSGLDRAEVVSNVSIDWDHHNSKLIDFHKHLVAAFDKSALHEWAEFAAFENAILNYQFEHLHEISEMIDSPCGFDYDINEDVKEIF